ncbi:MULTISPECIES: glucose-6-phosphate isomerase [Legionella]|uniref:Glucose-6-phosphate isomerase n=1 Tax=Legionella septentrionalis TaxID=2498109 RepID=A0A3S0XFS5_9GAMM|nr:glucose-6-phosphate isomerase [Legionella septentrionalis]RUQ84981.1 glucose-6-phosphate isomerase [Legionella septentrionalis]RUR02384.1 glucose-6-phosphate isomerase [Legionella septentrionalis]RUR10327.1 glucose-6-phosphate isomerase [Legionella septentrionalis]RUR17041.1 glucose-6-phosphate isomerase [Legionella septentrionalis]
MQDCTKTDIWKKLEELARLIPFNKSTVNAAKLVSACNITLDYRHQYLNEEIFELLLVLANHCELKQKIEALMQGEQVNHSEQRPALHTALRAPDHLSIQVNGQDVMQQVRQTRHDIKLIAEKIRSKKWLGYSGKPITDIINIGIGGSDLGPRFCLQALAEFTAPELNYHFISDADPNRFEKTVARLHPETTLFIVASKSFTTQETLWNAQKAIAWIGKKTNWQQHFIGVTANLDAAHAFGLRTVLPIWPWVGGRYSFCSAINLIAAIALGYEQFNHLLAGAHSMDEHFAQTSFGDNLPVLLALFGIWNNNFLAIHNLLILTYAQQLEQFVPYIQQLDMESNGKSIDQQGKSVHYATGPLVWGGSGNQVQHSYYQLLCQGTHKITADFITMDAFNGQFINEIAAAKMQVLAHGVASHDNPNGFIPGIPLNHIRMKNCTPYSIGALVALYEHKIFTQSVIWNINPFDQPGVESAKQNAAFATKINTAIS